MPVHQFTVEMTCSGCSNAVERVLGKLGDKVTKVVINVENKTVEIDSNLTSNELMDALRKTGKNATFIGVKK